MTLNEFFFSFMAGALVGAIDACIIWAVQL